LDVLPHALRAARDTRATPNADTVSDVLFVFQQRLRLGHNFIRFDCSRLRIMLHWNRTGSAVK